MGYGEKRDITSRSRKPALPFIDYMDILNEYKNQTEDKQVYLQKEER